MGRPFGASANDYDLFSLNSAERRSSCLQLTAKWHIDSVDDCFSNTGFPSNARVANCPHSGSPLALYLTYSRARLSLPRRRDTAAICARVRSRCRHFTWDSARTDHPFDGTNNQLKCKVPTGRGGFLKSRWLTDYAGKSVLSPRAAFEPSETLHQNCSRNGGMCADAVISAFFAHPPPPRTRRGRGARQIAKPSLTGPQIPNSDHTAMDTERRAIHGGLRW